MLVGEVLEDSDQFDCLASYENQALLDLQHGGRVLDVLRCGSPVDVLRMLGGDHLC